MANRRPSAADLWPTLGIPPADEATARIGPVLARLGIEDTLFRRVADLSGGIPKVGMAQAILHRPAPARPRRADGPCLTP